MPEVPHSSRLRGGALALLALLSALSALTAAPPAVAATAAPAPSRPVVTTDHGQVRGVGHGTYATYEGIPFAAPPTGRLRWQLPAPAANWRGVRDAGAPRERCAQQSPESPGKTVGSEDCLYLNVTTPTGRAAGKAAENPPDKPTDKPAAKGRPVLVWVHGGGFTSGSGSDYAGERLAVRGDAVVVTVNYRLGMLGFFGHPALGGAPDFGLADQQAALRWVRANAAGFGGDPRNVTLFGESAGALSTCAQLVSPGSAGLFHKAVAQSGSCMTQIPAGATDPGGAAYSPWTPQNKVRDAGADAARRLGCADGANALACLRGLPLAKLVTPELTEAFSTVAYGNALLPERPERALEAGRFHRVPVVQGTNHDEMRLFVAQTLANHPIPDANTYRTRLTGTFGSAAGAIEALYPAAKYPSPALAWSAVLTDRAWTCTTLRADRALAARVPTYGYEFSDPDAPVISGIPVVKGFPYGATHAFEMPYLFDIPAEPAFTPAQRELSGRMADYWTRFARTSRPDPAGAPKWPAFQDKAPLVLSLAPGAGGIRALDPAVEHHCAFWDAHR
ncbi:carboxylesterase/lipase family protein [Streptomyces sp. UNOC14_S4]|uniref:carboxylesterase/lipase family protein n=1 Tax=Streptomyces sp. UNOC14_S4 TaxID=2872340 RepID=UPI001E3B843C|nr:carboxylesterase family protein [Streptomyces sp. UNOC14_S4]MCC3767311.1 carboxylesterase family protein [Streptomyces sp. UNOC14_S4]